MKETKFRLVNMMLSEGCLEILEVAKDGKAKQFTEFRNLKNSRTGKYFSPTTVSTRLKELVALKALNKVVTSTDKGRDVVGYEITTSGLKALDIAKHFEEELQKVLKSG